MCLVPTHPIMAERDIRVWKVASYINGVLELPFDRDASGYSLNGPMPRFFDEIYYRPAAGFHDGFGFHGFLNKDNALEFLLLIKEKQQKSPDVQAYALIPCIIPKGSMYAEAFIQETYYGAGLMAVRCQRLRRDKT